METYLIEPDGRGAFLVRVTRPDGSTLVIGGFPTLDKAKEWIASAMLALTRPVNGVAVADFARPQ